MTSRDWILRTAACLGVLLPLSTAHATVYEKELILANGPDANKTIIAVMGDGYTAAELPAYKQKVADLMLSGVFQQEPFYNSHHSAFNVYRIDSVSTDSGVSQRQYDLNDTPDDGSDDTIVSTTWKNTALGYIYSGAWAHCWMEPGPNSDARVQATLADNLPNADYVVIVMKESGGGGCGWSGRVAVTSSEGWITAAHELGHGVGTLYDEYTKTAVWDEGALNTKNCSTMLDRSQVVWSAFVDPSTPIETSWTTGMDPVETVGMFRGCHYHDSGIWRPAYNCMMRHGDGLCPVCRDVFHDVIEQDLDSLGDFSATANYSGALCRGVGGTKPTYTTQARANNENAAALGLSCAVPRLNVTAFSNRLTGWVAVVDQHPTENVCCHWYAKNPAGGADASADVCSSGASSDYQRLSLDYPKLYHDATYSHFELYCSVPAPSNGAVSGVLSYRASQVNF